MKKYISIIAICLLSFIMVGCFEDNKEVPIEDAKYIGIWTLTNSVTTSDGDTITASAIQFEENGNCVGSYVLEFQSGTVLEGKASGTCYLNGSGSKFKMVGEGSFFKEWKDFKDNGSTIKIGDWEYRKVN